MERYKKITVKSEEATTVGAEGEGGTNWANLGFCSQFCSHHSVPRGCIQWRGRRGGENADRMMTVEPESSSSGTLGGWVPKMLHSWVQPLRRSTAQLEAGDSEEERLYSSRASKC